MKRNLSILILVLAPLLLFSCGKNKVEEGKESVKEVKINRDRGDLSAMKVAYYEQDSVATQFRFYREVDSMLTRKQLDYQNELEKKIRAYQNYEAEIQKRMDNNEITGYEIEGIQRTAMEKQQAIQNFQQVRESALAKETMDYQTALMNKIAEAGKEFSKDRNIDLLFFYQKGGQITYIKDSYDVTEEFIDFLNQRESLLKSGVQEEVEALKADTSEELGLKK